MSSFSAVKISEHIYWVGAIDWELRNFHGYSTQRGTTYNAFLILGEEPILIDTVKAPFFHEMIERISSVIAPEKIKYIVSNHAEMDHSGSLPEAIKIMQPEKIFASKAGVTALQDHFHFDNVITGVSDGEELTLANIKLKFIDSKMLHWPESMFTFCVNDGVLFSQDTFGMHFATTKLFSEENDPGILNYESAKYFANILLPYASLVARELDKINQLILATKIIAPDHGPIWRTPEQIDWVVQRWSKFAKQDYYPKAVIIYDTMWNSTAKMAKAVADGLMQHDIAVKVLNLTINSRSDVITEILEAGALLVGSPTLNQQIFPSVADNLCYIKGLKPKNLVGQVFGSYGWGEKATEILLKEMQELGVELISEPIKVRYVPTDEALLQCHKLGEDVAVALQSRLGY